MKTLVETTPQNETKAETPAPSGPPAIPQGTKAPAPGDVGKSVADQLAKDEIALATANAEIVKLRRELADAKAKAKEELPKAPVSDADLQSAIDKLTAEANADLKADSPKPVPNTSLSAILGVRPDFTATQKANWRKVKAELLRRYSAKHRELLAARRKLFEKAKRNPESLVSTSAKVRTDGTVQRVALAIREPAKPKKPKANAKPKQIAGKVPAAGNAKNPAKVS